MRAEDVFTVRVIRQPDAYEVLECIRYSVACDRVTGDVTIRCVADPPAEHRLLVKPGERAYVMNGFGRTIDTIVPEKPAAGRVA